MSAYMVSTKSDIVNGRARIIEVVSGRARKRKEGCGDELVSTALESQATNLAVGQEA